MLSAGNLESVLDSEVEELHFILFFGTAVQGVGASKPAKLAQGVTPATPLLYYGCIKSAKHGRRRIDRIIRASNIMGLRWLLRYLES